MNDIPIRILLVTESDDRAARIQAAASTHAIEHTRELQDAIDRAATGRFEIVLLDPRLADAHDLEALARMRLDAPDLPIVLLTEPGRESMGWRAIQAGAHDFVPIDPLNAEVLLRSLRYAIERQRMIAELRELALRDELTGLYNRRGLTTVGEPYARIAERKNRPIVVLYVDLDDLKRINDVHGHAEGDRALCELAEILLETFRKSDVIARVGGDEFCAFLTETTPGAVEIAIARLYGVVAGHNARGGRPYRLSVSVGRASWDGHGFCDFARLVRDADRSMYQQKQRGLKAA